MASLLRHPLETTHSLGAGVLARLRGWFEACRPSRAMASDQKDENLAETRIPASGAAARVLPFPIRGEAVLVQMAERLRQRIGRREWRCNPLLLTISRRPHSRLSIDQNTYVEFAGTMFRVVIEAEPGTRFTIETDDFDAVVSFVAPYVTERLAEAIPLESAS